MQTLEDRFGPELARHIELAFASAPGVQPTPQAQWLRDHPDQVGFVNDHPHLWPFFCFPGDDTFAHPLGTADAPQVDARIYHGLWIVDCPFCRSAQHASSDDPWFFCAHCKNTAVGNKSIPTAFPAERARIESVLEQRPFMHARNWFPHETVADLERENTEHLGAPE